MLEKVRLDMETIDPNRIIALCEWGKDIEDYVGYYGSRFTFEYVRVIFERPNTEMPRSMTDRFHYRRGPIDLPFSSNFDLGMGQTYFNEGIGKPIVYNNIADYDINLTYTFHHKVIDPNLIKNLFPDTALVKDVEINTDSTMAFQGTSSLQLFYKYHNTNELMMHKLYKTELNAQEDTIISAAIQCSANISEVYWIFKLSTGKTYAMKYETTEKKNNWIISRQQFTFPIPSIIKGIYIAAKPSSKELYLSKARGSSFFYAQINFGHFAIYNGKKHFIDPTQVNSVLQVKELKVSTFVNPKTAILQDNNKAAIDVELHWEMDKNLEEIISNYKVFM